MSTDLRAPTIQTASELIAYAAELEHAVGVMVPVSEKLEKEAADCKKGVMAVLGSNLIAALQESLLITGVPESEAKATAAAVENTLSECGTQLTNVIAGQKRLRTPAHAAWAQAIKFRNLAAKVPEMVQARRPGAFNPNA